MSDVVGVEDRREREIVVRGGRGRCYIPSTGPAQVQHATTAVQHGSYARIANCRLNINLLTDLWGRPFYPFNQKSETKDLLTMTGEGEPEVSKE